MLTMKTASRACSALFASLALAACAAPVSQGSQGEEGSAAPEEEATSAAHEELTTTIKKCTAGPFTTSGFGNACPNKYAVATELCELGGFVNGYPAGFSCGPIPGSIPQQYLYSLTYKCLRAEPCSP